LRRRLANDLRVALRGFRRTPTFAVTVIAILGLGIGMAAATFSAFETLLVRRLPVTDQDRVAVMWTYHEPTIETSPLATDLPELRRSSRTMRDIAGVVHYGVAPSPFGDGRRSVVLARTMVTTNYFDVLGARPLLGRLLRRDDELPGAPHVVVLSYGAWQSRFGGDPSIVGRQIVDLYVSWPYTIVGVAPPGLDYPAGIEMWMPIQKGWSPRVLVVARLKANATLDAARAELTAIAQRLQPSWKLTGTHAETLTMTVLGSYRPILIALAAAVSLLLLIACVNVGTLFLVRAAARARELAIRRALGASYGDLVRQLVVESGLLAIAGGALGVVCATLLLRGLVLFAPARLPRLDDIRLHGSLLGIGIGLTSIAVLLFGVLPALAAARVDLATPLRSDARSGVESRDHRRVRDWLVASQVALALVMLAGAGLLGRSLLHLERLPLGYRAEHLSILSVAYDATRVGAPEQMLAWGEEVQQRLRGMPGITSVTPIVVPPFYGPNIWSDVIEAEAVTRSEKDATPTIPIELAGAEYFRTFDTPVIRGRGFAESDREGAPKIVVVSESVARRFWGADEALGKRIRVAPIAVITGNDQPKGFYDWRTVVGVVPDTRFRALREALPTVYVPWRQAPGWQGAFAVRSSTDIGALAPSMRRAVHDLNTALNLYEVRSMDALLAGPLSEPRLSAFLLAAFGLVALTLSAVGLYAVMASSVRRQTREIGIRVALGATPAIIRGSVLRRALTIAMIGSVVGLAGALATTRLLSAILYDVSPTDPVTLAAVSLLLLIVATLAAYIPARRATRIDPVEALRAD
jgi:putative ABC transport system permease protein